MANNSRRESSEVAELLAQLDRRSAVGRSDSATLQLRQILGGLAAGARENLTQILSENAQAADAVLRIAVDADAQSTALSETTTLVKNMSVDLDDISQNADLAKNSADEACHAAETVQRMFDELQGELNRFRAHVETAERKMRALGERSQEIGSIVQVIESISSRTDLLALNASIESFRAGEHGRGFSIVTDEVRKLAEQTARSTREVSALIESIQLETKESILAMAEQRSHVEAEANRFNLLEQRLGEIRSTCGQSLTGIGDILRAAHHQLKLTQDLVLNVEGISNTARSNRTSAEEVGFTLQNCVTVGSKIDHSLTRLRSCSNPNPDDRSADLSESTDKPQDAAIPTHDREEDRSVVSVDEAMSLVASSLETHEVDR